MRKSNFPWFILAAIAIAGSITCLRAYIGSGSASSTYTNTVDWASGDWGTIAKTNFVIRNTNFVFALDAQFTNACAGTLDIAFTSGPDWGMENSAANPPESGWFSIPLTNSTLTTRVMWNTNVPNRSLAGWACTYMTNNSGQNLTNLSIRFFTKSGVLR